MISQYKYFFTTINKTKNNIIIIKKKIKFQKQPSHFLDERKFLR